MVGAAISNVKASIAAANALPPKATDAAPAVAAEDRAEMAAEAEAKEAVRERVPKDVGGERLRVRELPVKQMTRTEL